MKSQRSSSSFVPEWSDSGHHHLSVVGQQQTPHDHSGLHHSSPTVWSTGASWSQVGPHWLIRHSITWVRVWVGGGRVCLWWLCLSYSVWSSKFRLSYYPHRLESFKDMLKEAFDGRMEHSVYGDFQTYVRGQSNDPCYFIHVCKKSAWEPHQPTSKS